MTKYGSTDEMQKQAWGNTKSSTPAIVTSVQNTVTALINIALGRIDDYSTVPEYINQIANLVGSEILRSKGTQQPLTTPQILDMIKVLTNEYMDQAPPSETHWGTVRIV
jgi:hypothetical protein